MMNNYLKRSALLLGAAVLLGASANADTWRNLNNEKLINPAFIPGWSGGLTATADGVAECYNGAFDLYQVINDVPAGEYTLTVNAFYRYASNEDSELNMKDGANHNAYIYINVAKQTVEGKYDKAADSYPNSTWEANEAFVAGRYVNTVKFNHAGGETPAEKTVLWKNGVHSTTEWVSWSGVNRFGLEGRDGNNECTYTFPAAQWETLKTNPFYVVIKDIRTDLPDDQNYHMFRITDGWWSAPYLDGVEDNTNLETDNGDGTRTIKVDLTANNSPLLGTIDEKHILFTGHNFTLDEIYVTDGSGISDIVVEPVMDGRIYNMLGIEVDSNYKGLVIKNGKKYIQR